MEIITKNDLSLVFEKRLEINKKNAERYADIVMDYFGFYEYIIDNLLNEEDRRIFYMLEENRLLTTDKIETTLYDGRPWRIYYWQLKKRMISRYLQEINQSEKSSHARVEMPQKSEPETIYNYLSNDFWNMRKSPST